MVLSTILECRDSDLTTFTLMKLAEKFCCKTGLRSVKCFWDNIQKSMKTQNPERRKF